MKLTIPKREALRLADLELRVCCSLAAWLLAACADSPVPPPAAAMPQDPPSLSHEMRDAAAAMRDRDAWAGSAAPNSAAPNSAAAGAGGKAGMLAGAAAGGRAAPSAGKSATTADDDAGVAGAAGMSGQAGAPHAPVLSDNDVYLEEGIRPAGVRRCYTKESNDHPAIVHFRKVFDSSDYAARDSVIDELKEAEQDHPAQEQFALFLGLANLWRVNEPQNVRDRLLIAGSATDAHDALERAYALCPSDFRIPGWLAPTKIMMGNLAGNVALRDEGVAMLREGIEHYPTFVVFSNALVYGDLPPDDPQFKKAVAEIRDVYSLPIETNICNEWKLDPACINSPTALHNLEASAPYVGDLYARAQDREGALAWYTIVKKLPDWSHPAWTSWRYMDLLEERVRTLDQRMKAAATPSTNDDLESIWHSTIACTICHSK